MHSILWATLGGAGSKWRQRTRSKERCPRRSEYSATPVLGRCPCPSMPRISAPAFHLLLQSHAQNARASANAATRNERRGVTHMRFSMITEAAALLMYSFRPVVVRAGRICSCRDLPSYAPSGTNVVSEATSTPRGDELTEKE